MRRGGGIPVDKMRHLILILLAAAWLCAQDQSPLITSVVVEGNNTTRDYIIIRELSHPLHQPFDSTQAREDRDRLYNLGIFEWVDISLRRTGPGEAALVVEVVETIRMVPVPIFYYLEELGWAYGGGMSYLNFRGLNQRLDLAATIGAEKTYKFIFSDPWMLGNQIGVKGWLYQIYRRHLVHEFRMQVRDMELGLAKSNAAKTVGLSGALSLEQRVVHWLEPGRPDTVHRVFQSKVAFLLRTTDIWRDPTRGVRLYLSLSPVVGLDDQSPTYTYLGVGGAWFHPLRRGSRPLVFGTGLSVAHYQYHNQIRPLYLQQYLGGYRVRGYSVNPDENPPEVKDRHETTSLAAASIELRQSLIPRRLLWGLEVGLSGVLFLDAGWSFGPGLPLEPGRPMVGYGLGLRLFLPVIHVLAFDLGANPYDFHLRWRFRVNHAF